MIFLAPAFSIITRPENAAAEIGAGEEVSTRADNEGEDKLSGQSIVDLRPAIAVISRPEHTIAIDTGENVTGRSDNQSIDVVRGREAVIDRHPTVSIVG